jgi:cytoskeletal protein CcmA (bactofilin family)
MFNKPILPPRNENLPRNDMRNGLNPSDSRPAPIRNEATAAPATTLQAAPPTPAPAPTEPVAGEAISGSRLIVGPDVKLKGAEILDCDTLVVEGRVEATMDSRVIRIADQGAYSGKVSIDIAEIHGSFDGELTARAQLIIHATGRVSGKIRYGKLVIDEGGELRGDINTLSAESSPPSRIRHEPVTALAAIAG